MIISCKSEQETQKFGQKLAHTLKGGEIIGLIGELGSGKTTFVKGLAKGLGIRDLVTSPTFVMVREYPLPNHPIIQSSNRLTLVHIDLYRLKNPKEIETIGLSDYLGKPDKIVVIEWADKIKNLLPKETKYIEFDFVDENSRKIKVL